MLGKLISLESVSVIKTVVSIPLLDSVPVSNWVLELKSLRTDIIFPYWINIVGHFVFVEDADWGSRSSWEDGVGGHLAGLDVLSDSGEEVTELHLPVGIILEVEAFPVVEPSPVGLSTVGSHCQWLESEIVGSHIGFHQLVSELEDELREELHRVWFRSVDSWSIRDLWVVQCSEASIKVESELEIVVAEATVIILQVDVKGFEGEAGGGETSNSRCKYSFEHLVFENIRFNYSSKYIPYIVKFIEI